MRRSEEPPWLEVGKRTQDTDLSDEPVHVHKFCPRVSKTRGRGRSFFIECCFRVRVNLDTNPNPNVTLTLKQHSLKKRETPAPRLLTFILSWNFEVMFYYESLKSLHNWSKKKNVTNSRDVWIFYLASGCDLDRGCPCYFTTHYLVVGLSVLKTSVSHV